MSESSFINLDSLNITETNKSNNSSTKNENKYNQIKQIKQIKIYINKKLKLQANIFIYNILKENFQEKNVLNKDDFLMLQGNYKYKLEFILLKKRFIYDCLKNKRNNRKKEIKIKKKLKDILKTKIVDIKQGEIKYQCKISIVENYKKDKFLQAELFLNDKPKLKGKISKYKIKAQIGYDFHDINNIFKEIYKLKDDNFQIINNKLKIDIIILEKTKIEIDLVEKENDNDVNNDQEKTISDVNELIQKMKKKINLLKSQIENKYYDDFNIELKKPIHQLNNHTHYVYCSTLLRDRRFATGSLDNSIIIYNNKTFEPDITIKEHRDKVLCIIQLSCGLLASCSVDKTIKLYNINGNNYTVIQTLNDHTDSVFHIIELKNKNLVSCSSDETIKFYNIDDNNKYELDYSINTNGFNGPVIQTKYNEICYQECIEKNDSICFYDIIEKKVIAKLDNIKIPSYVFNCMIMIKKDLLLVSGYNELYIININLYKLVKIIDSPDSGYMVCNLLLNENMLLTGDNNGRLIQWKIENDNLQRFSIKEKAHDARINTLLKIGNGLILSGSDEMLVKIW